MCLGVVLHNVRRITNPLLLLYYYYDRLSVLFAHTIVLNTWNILSVKETQFDKKNLALYHIQYTYSKLCITERQFIGNKQRVYFSDFFSLYIYMILQMHIHWKEKICSCRKKKNTTNILKTNASLLSINKCECTFIKFYVTLQINYLFQTISMYAFLFVVLD